MSDVGRVTLNLSGEEAKQLLADMDHAVKLSADSPTGETRQSIFDKLERGVGRSAHTRSEQ